MAAKGPHAHHLPSRRSQSRPGLPVITSHKFIRIVRLLASPWAAACVPAEPLLGLLVPVLVRVSAQGQHATRAPCTRHVQLTQRQPCQAPVHRPSALPLIASFGKAPMQGLVVCTILPT